MPVLPAPSAPTTTFGARFTTLASPSRGSAETACGASASCRARSLCLTPSRARRSSSRSTVRAVATLDDVDQTVLSGDTLVLLAGVEFRLVATGAVPFRALVCLPVGGQAAMIGCEPFTPPWAE